MEFFMNSVTATSLSAPQSAPPSNGTEPATAEKKTSSIAQRSLFLKQGANQPVSVGRVSRLVGVFSQTHQVHAFQSPAHSVPKFSTGKAPEELPAQPTSKLVFSAPSTSAPKFSTSKADAALPKAEERPPQPTTVSTISARHLLLKKSQPQGPAAVTAKPKQEPTPVPRFSTSKPAAPLKHEEPVRKETSVLARASAISALLSGKLPAGSARPFKRPAPATELAPANPTGITPLGKKPKVLSSRRQPTNMKFKGTPSA